MPTIDDVLTAASAHLLARTADDTDVDASLRAFRAAAEPGIASPRMRRPLWIIAAAACVAAGLGVGAAVVDDDTRPHQVSPASTTAEPSTVAPTPTSDTSPTETTADAGPMAHVLTVDYEHQPPLYDPVAEGGLITAGTETANELSTFAVGPTGHLVIVNVDQQTAILVDPGLSQLATITLPEGGLVSPVLGPSDVLYGLWHDPTSAPDELDAVAIPFSGPQAGEVVSVQRHNANALVELPVNALGLGRTGVVERTGRVDGDLIGYVDGATLDIAEYRYDPETGDVHGPGGPWKLDIRTAPDHSASYTGEMAYVTDGGAVFFTTVGARQRDDEYAPNAQPVIAELRSDGTGVWWSLPEGWRLVASDLGGTLLARTGQDGRADLAWFRPPENGPGDGDSSVETIAVDDLEPFGEPCSGADCPTMAISPTGEIVMHDSSTRTLTFMSSGQVVTHSLTGSSVRLVAVGPDDVAYFTVWTEGGEPVGELVAVATTGPRAGEEIGRGGPLDFTGDSFLQPTSSGIVEIGCCRGTQRTPGLDAEPVVPWLDELGVALPPQPVDLWVEYPADGSTTTIVRAAEGLEQRWEIDTPADRDAPLLQLTNDGGALAWVPTLLLDPASSPTLFVLRPDGSTHALVMPQNTFPAAMSSNGRVIVTHFNGSDYRFAFLPTEAE